MSCLLRHTADNGSADRPRAVRLMAATAAMAASTSLTLCFSELASWQRLVLGALAPFRDVDAFAKGGRERMGPSNVAELDAFFADAVMAGDDAPLWWRASRLYADVLFVHPFADGNARCARLALVWLLRREDVAVVGLDPVWRMPWSPHTVGALARTMRVCLGRA
jgi:hypothetical protein